MKRLLLSLIFLWASTQFLAGQNLTGIWRGYFITDTYEQYRFEVQMEQTKSNTLTGVTYSYLDKEFYGKCTMTGNFTRENSNTLIQEVKTIEVKIKAGRTTCIQKCLLTYVKEGKEEFLEGTFTSKVERTSKYSGAKKGDDCGGGKMYLRKVTTSDFYIEPFLRKKTVIPNSDPPVAKTNPATNKKPATSNNQKTTNKPPATTQKNNTGSNQNKNTVTVKPKTDSVSKAEVATAKPNVQENMTIKSSSKLPDKLALRENNLVRILVINSENVTVKLYDNGEIDDDTISIFLDKQLILSKKRLTASALTINLKMDESNNEHELVMVAENLGRIPPNTSLMIVNAGDQRFEVRITSTEQKNAVVRFKYEKPGGPKP